MYKKSTLLKTLILNPTLNWTPNPIILRGFPFISVYFRSKRVVDKTVERPKLVPIEDAYYIVSLLENGYHIFVLLLFYPLLWL